jgi:uncharacterized protein YbdZ (MbtH family)
MKNGIYSHTFLLINNKFYTIKNNHQNYSLDDVTKDFPYLHFVKHINTIYIDDKWTDYGKNHIIRMKKYIRPVSYSCN